MHVSDQGEVLISVVMCTYNGEKFLRAQLDSIVEQTYKNLEIIVYDDASTDNTPNILRDYASHDSRFRIFYNDENIGIKLNFTRALTKATGSWIAIADQDDVWVTSKLQQLLKLVKDDVLLVHSYNAEFSGDNPKEAIINRSRKRFKGRDTSELMFYNTMYGHSMLISKLLLEYASPFPEKVFYDWWLGVIATLHGSVALSEEVLVYHRIHAANFSRSYLRDPGCYQRQVFFKSLGEMLTEFSHIPLLSAQQRTLLSNYKSLVNSEWNKPYSLPMFLFLLKHARTAFYYRKKTPMFFYYLKYSHRKATMQIRYWL